MSNWKHPKIDMPEDEKNYLVCWLEYGGTYSNPHRAYYSQDEEKFFSLESFNSHPLVVDAYMEMPKSPKEKE